MHKSFRDIYVSAEVRRIHMMKKKPAKGLQALASGTLALARCHTVLDKTEQQLEHAIERENRAPKTMIERAQMKGEKLIHTKPVLLCVVMLNIIDCILVLGELVLDMYYIKALMESHEDVTHTFITEMKILYPNVLYNIGKSDIEPLYDNILHAQIDWDNFTMAHSKSLQDHLSATNITKLSLQHSIVKRGAELPSHIDKFINDRINHTHFHNNRHVEDHPIEEVLAHAFHKASISILCILAAENLFKIFSYGKAFFERKLEQCLDVVQKMAIDGGIPEPKISQHLALLQQKQNKKNKTFEENIKQSLPLSPFKKSSESSSSEPLSVENGTSCRTVYNYADEDNNTISNVGGTGNNMV
ncbi:unnamed protein product [Mytilus coruscus]|uniref:Uncharacterized protein n=1 Tax=Mytilus coruscus TaxID=42192 RepID=A0A6J8C451_MYTCO|nr:unnamed protein product [Mytilus coruscus]